MTATTVSPGNAGDVTVAEELIADLLEADEPATSEAVEASDDDDEAASERRAVYGDAAYGAGELQPRLQDARIDSKLKTQPPVGKNGLFAKDRFTIDIDADTVTCPAKITAKIGRLKDRRGVAKCAEHCASCPLKEQCTTSALGRKVRVGVHEAALARVRAEQADPKWRGAYRQTRPKVERKLAHLMRHRHGGRRARVRGTLRVNADFSLLSAAANFACLAKLGVRSIEGGGWVVAR